MSEVVIHGVPVSSYVRTARMICAEKGVAHRLEKIQLGSDEHRALHPFAKMPIFDHGEVRLYETIAIAHYVDATFDGPALIPDEAHARVRTHQWVSIATSYLYPQIIRGVVLHYVFPKGDNGEIDRDAVDAARPQVEHHLGVLEHELERNEWLAGPFGIADLFVTAIVSSLKRTPEAALLERVPHVRRHLEAVAARPAGPYLVPRD